MLTRIEVGFKDGVTDARGERVKKRIREDLGIQVAEVRTADVYTVLGELQEDELTKICEELFCDPLIQEYSINEPLKRDHDWIIEIGFKPGVTDNVGKTSEEGIRDALGKDVRVFTSTLYFLKGVSRDDAERIARELLANELINRIHITRDSRVVEAPLVREDHEPKVRCFNLKAMSDEELLKFSKERTLALSLEELHAIRDYFYSPRVMKERMERGLPEHPTDVEIEAIAQTWSEHCKHKIFNALIEYEDEETGEAMVIDSLFRTFIKRSTEEIRREKGEKDICVSVFSDNAGIMKFNDDYNIALKVETHNTPSALDPYGGALTGILGVNRDVLGAGKGAKPIFNTDVFCFASPFYSGDLPPRILHPKRIFEGVRLGVEHGGNKSGIPTVNGCIVFDDRYLGKPLVYCGTGGIMPSKIKGEPSHEKRTDDGDLAVMVGGRVGKDGIHGATFSSEELHIASPTSAVQIGDPITQKKMIDFILEARDRGLIKCITDNGAGGLSSSIGETARFSNGCEIYLERVPLKYHGLDPWEILLSESQERMTVAVSPDKIDEFLELAKKMDVEATVVGKYTSTGKFHVMYEGRTVAYIDMDFLHEGVPQMKLKARWRRKRYEEPELHPEDLNEELLNLLSRLNICSKEYVIRQYDHEVQGGSVIKPLVGVKNDGPSDAAVIRPLLDSFEGLVISNGIIPRYSDIDTYHMVACALDEAIRNNVAVGGDIEYMVALDNFCWCDPIKSESNPDGDFKLAQLVRANMALYDYTKAFGVPCISGKDSMKNDYVHENIRISIPPTVLFTAVSKIEDVRKTVTMDVKREGDLVYILGFTKDELGASEYYAMHGYIGNRVPEVNAREARERYLKLRDAIHEGLISSCHDCSDGGLAVALAETSFSGGLGMEIHAERIPSEPMPLDHLLFSETQSRFIVTVSPEKKERFEEVMKGTCFAEIGVVRGDSLVIKHEGEVAINLHISELEEAWKKTLRW
ncbi:MAG: phosphoribosylformylglycinamidine synthase subunit PurSL [Archaeoglobi archaeon]|nr:phosphoribosylformylglycinamidine synthase subunit PurSL [Archaeoglobi archaeon]MDK2781167.1 phosphoribosylformylglycinamidine synthase subunit PurSL [Archaeoglobi archaeon]